MKKLFMFLNVMFLALFIAAGSADAAATDSVIQRWTKVSDFKDKDNEIAHLEIRATYYSAEFIEAYVQSQAQKNMWTQQEADDYKYKFLAALQLDTMIPIQMEFNNNAESMYMGPFDNFVQLRVGNKVYKPADYDKRFNFKLQGKREGLVYFRRYDEKTGKDLLKGIKQVTLELKSIAAPNLIQSNYARFVWDIGNDDPQKLYQGKTAARFETDRLLKRLDKIRKDKGELQKQVDTLSQEETTIQKRLDELGKQ